MEPKLKPPGTKRLKVKYDILVSNSCFKFNLRRYTMVGYMRDAAAVVNTSTSEAGTAYTQCRGDMSTLSLRNRGSIYSRMATRSDFRRIARWDF
jgi:hypothetical protein